jgi:hypothetical protein
MEIWDDHEFGQAPPDPQNPWPIELIYSNTINGRGTGWYRFEVPSNVLAYLPYSSLPVSGDTDDEFYTDQLGKRTPNYFIALRYIDPDKKIAKDYRFKWGCDDTDMETTWYQDLSKSDWKTQPKKKLSCRLIYFENDLSTFSQPSNLAGDNIVNLREFVVGTNPKLKNTDEWQIETKIYNDGLNDGKEVGYDSDELEPEEPVKPCPIGGVIFRTNVVEGAINFEKYGKASDWIEYDGDGEGTQLLGYKYEFSETLINPPASDLSVHLKTGKKSGGEWDLLNILLFTLKDGTKIYMSPDVIKVGNSWKPGSNIYIWEPNTNLNKIVKLYDFENQKLYSGVQGICHKFTRDTSKSMDTYYPNLEYRNQEIYLSNPWSFDTDLDGINDGLERTKGLSLDEWKLEAEAESINDGIVPVDTKINVRDEDSDNDGLTDAAETAWMLDTDSDTYLNVADWDSDDDELIDVEEPKHWYDSDYDGTGDKYIKWVDNDSDGFAETPVATTESQAEYTYSDSANMLDDDADDDGLFDGPENEPYIVYDDLSSTKIYSHISLLDETEIETSLEGVAVDNKDNVYFFDNYKLKKLKSGYNELDSSSNPDTNSPVTLLKSLSDPRDLEIDKKGNIYFTDGGTLKTLSKSYKEDGTEDENHNYNINLVSTLVTDLSTPIGITIDENGYNKYLYFIEQPSSSISFIKKYDIIADTTTIIFHITTALYGITIDANGNLFFTTTTGVKMLPDGFFDDYSKNYDLVKTLYSSLFSVKHIDIDGDGNLYFIANDNIKMLKNSYYQNYPLQNTYYLKDIYLTDSPKGIAVSKDKHIFYTDDSGQDELIKLPYASTRTIHPDSDCDGLVDGYDIVENQVIQIYGELLSANRELSDDPLVYQTVRTNQLDFDTDNDGLCDGYQEVGQKVSGVNEYLAWWYRIQEVSSTTGEKGTVSDQIYAQSDPTKIDTDDDDVLDSIESWYSNPCDSDSDGDGIDDGVEDSNDNGIIELGETNLLDKDSDDDRLPDGWIDGIVDSNGDDVIDEDDADENADPWEGEDLDCNGEIDGDTNKNRIWDDGEPWEETNPLGSDSDGDSIADGDEIYFDLRYHSGSKDDINTTDTEDNDESLDGSDQNTIIDYWDTSDYNQRSYLDLDGDGKINPLDTDSDGDGLLDYDENRDHDDQIDGIIDSYEELVTHDGDVEIEVWSKDDWSGDQKLYLPNGDDTGAVLTRGVSGEYFANFEYGDSVNVTINESEILYIEKDLILRFDDLRGIAVDGGELYIYGEAGGTDWVTLTKSGPCDAYWSGITIKNTNKTEIVYCKIEYAKGEGQYDASIFCDNSAPVIYNNQMFGNDTGKGIYAIDSNPIIASNDIRNYDIAICSLKTPSDEKTDEDATIYENDIHDNDIGIQFADNDATHIVIQKNNIRKNSNYGIENPGDDSGWNISWNFIAGNNDAYPDEGEIYDPDDDEWNQLKNCVDIDAVSSKYQLTYQDDTWDNYYFKAAYETNPYDADTDDDCIRDGDDLHNYNNDNISEWKCDYDGDGLINAMDMDSDDDSYIVDCGDRIEDDADQDGVKEISTDHNGYWDISAGEYNPLATDSDNDGIRDGVELFWGLDGVDKDTDDDGIMDGDEVYWNCDFDKDGYINANDPDSDGDGISDGTEIGVTSPISSVGQIKGTDTTKKYPGANSRTRYIADADPNTKTNPLSKDTDNDGLYDGWDDENGNGEWDSGEEQGEDLSYNGSVDEGESDPKDKDSDDDGVNDGATTEGVDGNGVLLDTDEDGTNNVVDTDSDGDGIWDGVELGLTLADISIYTDADVFTPDADPSTSTEPLDDDTDNDGIIDGDEDFNYDGAIAGDTDRDENIRYRDEENEGEVWTETNPNTEDSDGDGLLDGYDIDKTEEEFQNIFSDDDNYWGELSYSNHDLDPRENYQKYQAGPTNPVNRDSDGDFLWDGPNKGSNNGELHKHYTQKNYQLRWEDTQRSTIGQDYYTDPKIADTDDDGLIDGIEISGWKKVNILNGKTLEFEEEGREVSSNPTVKDTDEDNKNSEFPTSDFDEWSYGSDPESVDTDGDYIFDNDENASTITQIEAEEPFIDEISGYVKIKYKKELGCIPWPDKLVLDITVPISDNAGLDKVDISLSNGDSKTVYLDCDKKTTIEAEFKADLWGSLVTGYDVKVIAKDVNGNTKEGETHIDGALEGLIMLILSFLIAAILLAIAFLGSAVIPIIMVACAVTIAIAVGVIIGRMDTWRHNIQKNVEEQDEIASSGGNPDGKAIVDQIFESIMIIAFTTLLIAVSILFLCLKAYTSLGSWVMDEAVDMATKMVLTAFLTCAIMCFLTAFKDNEPTKEIIEKVMVENLDIDLKSYVVSVASAVLTAIGLIKGWVIDTAEALITSIIGLLLVLIAGALKGPEKIFTILVAFSLSVWGLLKGIWNAKNAITRGEKLFNSVSAVIGGIGAVMGGIEYFKWVEEYYEGP